MKITICGPAASGKGTIARRFATEAGIGYVDLGLLFRLGAYALTVRQIAHLEELFVLIRDRCVEYIWTGGKSAVHWQGEDITPHLVSEVVANQTSVLASDPIQQDALTEIANWVLASFDSAICDGRNAGTTILPDADFKFFVTASLEVRARRRHLDILQLRGTVSYGDVLREVEERDGRDAGRAANPFVVPPGAILLATDTRSVEESVRFIWEVIREKW